MIVNEQKYRYAKLLAIAKEQANNTVEIPDEEAERLGLKDATPIIPVNPGDDIENNPDGETPSGGNDSEEIPSDEHDYSQDYLTFEAIEDGTFSFSYNDLYYSKNNGETWIALAAGTQTDVIPAGNKILWKRDSNIKTKDGCAGIGVFSSTGKFNVMGNILSLRYTDFMNKLLDNTNNFDKHCFRYLFSDCNNLISAQHLILPNTDLTGLCYKGYYFLDAGLNGAIRYEEYVSTYQRMFYRCKNLITAPKLPAIQLCDLCYESMFYDCISLEKAPKLLAIKLEEECYKSMFSGCTNLKHIKMMATDISATNCLNSWVTNISPTGTFIKNKDLSFSDIGSSGIPSGWEVIEEELEQ